MLYNLRHNSHRKFASDSVNFNVKVKKGKQNKLFEHSYFDECDVRPV